MGNKVMINRKQSKTEQRRTTLKLWQQHIQALSKPESEKFDHNFDGQGLLYNPDSAHICYDHVDENDRH